MNILFAPGAGASSASEWMQAWAIRLGAFAEVTVFDYPYMKAGRRAPDRLPKLVDAHKQALVDLRKRSPGPLVLVGKSMGGRVGCHVSLEEQVDAVVCFGYPLSARGKLRDQVLLEMETKILFVQGSKDPLCPLDTLENVRKKMTATNELHHIDGGSHSLQVGKRKLQELGKVQEDIDNQICDSVERFLT